MKSTGKLVALLLLLTVFLIKMASEILGLGFNSAGKFVPYIVLFAIVLIAWLSTMLWQNAWQGTLKIFTAVLSLLLVVVVFAANSSLDLVAVLCALILFTISLGKGGETHSGAEMPSTRSSIKIATQSSKDSPRSVVIQKSSKKYIASKRGRYYHKEGSEWAEKIKPKNQVWFDSEAAANNAGYKAHKDLN